MRKGLLALVAMMIIPHARSTLTLVDVSKPTSSMLAHPQEQAGGSDGEQEWWMLDLSPNSDVDESAQSEQGQETQMITTQVLLTLLILPAFFAMAYQEDVVRLARASRVALEQLWLSQSLSSATSSCSSKYGLKTGMQKEARDLTTWPASMTERIPQNPKIATSQTACACHPAYVRESRGWVTQNATIASPSISDAIERSRPDMEPSVP